MSFTFNSTNCESYNMFVEKYPNRPIPQRKLTTYSIAGRSGDLIIDQEAYDNVIQEYEVFVKKDSIHDLQKWVSLIAQWLIGSAGYHELTDTYDTTVKRYARVANAVEFVNSLNAFGRATLQFDCKPQRYPVTAEVFTGAPTDTIIYPNKSDIMPAFPKLTLSGVAANCSLSITDTNGLTIVIPQRGTAIATILIDWENQTIINPFNNSIPSNSTASGTWGKLGNGSSVTITLDSGDSPTFSFDTRRFFL